MADETKTRKKPGPKSKVEEKSSFLAEARQRLDDGLSGDKHNRDEALKELEFAYLPGKQWDDKSRQDREGRLCLEFNQLPTFIDQVTGASRKNKHSGKIHPESEDADIETAEIIEGYIRRVESRSHAAIAYDIGREQAADGGFGYWRVRTDYESDDITRLNSSLMNQTCFIDPIVNRFSVVFGYSQEWHRQDAEFCFVLTSMSEEEFKRKYPKATTSTDLTPGEVDLNWYPEKRVTIAEYFVKEYFKKKVYQLPMGEVVEEIPDEFKEFWPQLIELKKVREREVDSYKIYRYLISGHEILEDKQLWASKYWPIVPCEGKGVNIQGKTYRRGVVKYAVDSQKAYNFLMTTDVETAAFSPKNPWLVEARQIEGHYPLWARAHKEVLPFLVYKHVEGVPRPDRQPPPQGAPALLASAMAHRDGLRLTTGVSGVSSLDPVEEKSGIALQTRNIIGETGTFHYSDNADRSIKLTWEIILDLIPTILDTNRMIQVEDLSGNIKEEEINKVVRDQATGQEETIKDLSRGKYGVTISSGPSHETQRAELLDFMFNLLQLLNPMERSAIAHVMVKNADVPGAQEIGNKLLMVAPDVTLSEEEKKEKEKYAGPQQAPPPPPELMIKIEELYLKTREQDRKEFEAIMKATTEVMKAEAAEYGEQFSQTLQSIQQVQAMMEAQAKQEEAAKQQSGGGQGADGGDIGDPLY